MAVTVSYFNKFLENVGKGNIDLDSHTFKVILVNNYIYDATDENKADIGSVELATGNGYTAGGNVLGSPSFAFVTDRTKWDGNDVTFTASGGNIGPVTGAIIYDDTATNDKLVCYIDFGQAETVINGSDFLVTFNINGIFTIQ